MEMHQIRYFLAVARNLNFTRAAEECHVSQPSLTRAIKNLEAELGGDMFRRERACSHLTELGRAMLPLLTHSFESALAAKTQADSLKDGTTASLRLALSRTIDFDVVSGALKELGRVFESVNLSCHRVSGEEVVEDLRAGEAEIAIAGPINEDWDRLNIWPLFVETLCVTVRKNHPLALRDTVPLESLVDQHVIMRPYCEQSGAFDALLKANNVEIGQCHEVSSDRDAIRMIETGLGVGLLPASIRVGDTLCKIPLALPFERTIRIYSVSGRERSKALTGLINLLRSADWTRYQTLEKAA